LQCPNPPFPSRLDNWSFFSHLDPSHRPCISGGQCPALSSEQVPTQINPSPHLCYSSLAARPIKVSRRSFFSQIFAKAAGAGVCISIFCSPLVSPVPSREMKSMLPLIPGLVLFFLWAGLLRPVSKWRTFGLQLLHSARRLRTSLYWKFFYVLDFFGLFLLAIEKGLAI